MRLSLNQNESTDAVVFVKKLLAMKIGSGFKIAMQGFTL